MTDTIKDRTFIIYCATFPNGKCYVGCTCQSLKTRIRIHLYNANHTKTGLVSNAITEFMIDQESQVTWDVIETIKGRTLAFEAEKKWILEKRSNERDFGYNETLGGLGMNGIVFSKETREKFSKVRKGRIVSDEAKAKFSASRKGVKLSPESLAKRRLLSIKKRGWTDEQRQKMSILKKGIPHTKEHCLHISIGKTGKSSSLKGKKRTPKDCEAIIKAVGKPIIVYDKNEDIVFISRSAIDCARRLGITFSAIYNTMKRQGRTKSGYRLEYLKQKQQENEIWKL